MKLKLLVLLLSPFLLPLVSSAGNVNVAVVLPGDDQNIQGGLYETAKQGAKEGCPANINFTSQYTSCTLNLQSPRSEDEESYNDTVPKAANQSDFLLDIGYFAQRATHNSADQQQDKAFGIIDFEFTPPVTNIASILFKDDEEGYLAGLLAGEIGKDGIGKVVVIGGVDQPDVRRIVNGFAEGVKVSCPACMSYCTYTKSFDNDGGEADDVVAAISAINGVDVVFNAASITGTTALKRLTTENGIFAIGGGTDEWTTNWAFGSVPGSEKILTSIVRDYRVMVRQSIEMYLDASLPLGTTVLKGVANDTFNSVLRFADCHEACESFTPQLKEILDGYIQDLIAGKLKTYIDHKTGKSKNASNTNGTSCSQFLDRSDSSDQGNSSTRSGHHDNAAISSFGLPWSWWWVGWLLMSVLVDFIRV